MRTKKHRRGRCFLLAMPYSVCYDGKNTKKGENIMRKRCIALVLCLLTLAALTGCGESSAKTVTSNGVECYRVDGVCYPAVFGEPQLTGEEITALLDSGDTAEMAATVSTVPDALRLLKARQQDSEDIDSQDVETTLLRGSNQPRGWVDALLYLLAGDYAESGRIDLHSSSNYCAYAAIAQDGLYYAFDPFEIRGDCWLVLSGENYVNADAQKLADMLRTACGFSTPAYTANAYPVLSKEEQEQRKAFEQREYTDEEIQALASAGLTLDEAADKLHTIEDAALFLRASGYRIDEEAAHFLGGRYVNFNLNPGGYINGYGWGWGLPADYTYEYMAGTCAGTSNLMNRLLAGDYEEQGYVQYLGGHIFNYIKQDGYYYFCDFPRSDVISNTGLDYLMYVCQDPLEFKDYYCTNVFPNWDDSEDDNYLVLMYLYPRDGKDSLPIGDSGAYDYLTGGRSSDTISSEVEDTVVILYERDWYHHRFADVDPEAIPEECYDLIDGVMHKVNWRTGVILED